MTMDEKNRIGPDPYLCDYDDEKPRECCMGPVYCYTVVKQRRNDSNENDT